MPDTQRAEPLSRQKTFLAVYRETGSVRKSCDAMELKRPTVDSWIHRDLYGFKDQFRQALEDFREYLQDLAIGRVQDQKPNDNPVLLITLLNAHWPERYRRDGNTANTEVKEMMGEWKKWVKANKGKSKKDEGVTEAEEARRNAVDEVEKILSSRKNSADAD